MPVALLGSLATCATFVFFMVNIPTALAIYRNKSTGNVQFFPFLTMLLSCSVWVAYGYVKGDPALIAVNVIGSLLGLAYVVIYAAFMPASSRQYVNRLFMYSSLGAMVIALYMTLLDDEARVLQLGLLACCGSMALYGSPLSGLSQVIATRDASSISFPMCVMSMIVCGLWSSYGLGQTDPFIYLPNMVGFVLACIQLYVIFQYKDANKPVEIPLRQVVDIENV